MKEHCGAHQKKLTIQYPEKVPKKNIPTRDAQFILLHHPNCTVIYLEKQPAQGLWGGLWSLPQIEKNTCPITHVHKTHALQVQSSMPLPTLKHVFTHFKLNLYPTALCVQTHQHILPLNGRWIAISSLKNIGLPKPIQTIIQQFLKIII